MLDPAAPPRTAGPRRRRDPQATRAAILGAAERCFLERGFAATATSEIAHRAGVTKSLIHHHFGSKGELWNEVKRLRFREYYESQKETLTGARGTAALLRGSIVSYFRFLADNPDTVRIMSWRFVEHDAASLGQEEELFALGVERIREAQAAGELRRDLEPILLVKCFLALALHWFETKPLLCAMLGDAAAPEALDDRYLDTFLSVYFDGVRPR